MTTNGKVITCKYCKDPSVRLPLLKDGETKEYYHQSCREEPSALDRSTGLVLAKPILHRLRKDT